MIDRVRLKQRVVDSLANFRITALLGPRQRGKKPSIKELAEIAEEISDKSFQNGLTEENSLRFSLRSVPPERPPYAPFRSPHLTVSLGVLNILPFISG